MPQEPKWGRIAVYPYRLTSHSGYTWLELVVVVIVLAVLLALLSGILASREAARRMSCNCNLKYIALSLQNYAVVYKAFPPGTICSTSPVQPSNQYNVWAEAAQTGTGFHGTSLLLRLMPFLEGGNSCKAWDFHYGVSGSKSWAGVTNATLASWDQMELYCTARRTGVRPGDNAMLLSSSWAGGGTDYGGCAGRHAAFTLTTGYNICDATMYYEPGFFPSPFTGKADDTPNKRWGIFGRVNVSTTYAEITDGTANTIMIGELQRITDLTPASKDGWAVGGPATLFTTGAMMCRTGNTVVNVATPSEGSLMNNGFWGSPGSAHAGGANFGMADGSVRFMLNSMDPSIFALLGSMADGGPSKGWDN
jgi:prepilin-type processing-associated H-X9-DG protein